MCSCKVSGLLNFVKLYGVHKEHFLRLPGSYKENKLPVLLGTAPTKTFKRGPVWFKDDPWPVKTNIWVFNW